MSKADKMFEKIGYKKLSNKEHFFKIISDSPTGSISAKIEFDLSEKKVNIYVGAITYRDGAELLTGAKAMTLPELQAINEKVKELGWA